MRVQAEAGAEIMAQYQLGDDVADMDVARAEVTAQYWAGT